MNATPEKTSHHQHHDDDAGHAHHSHGHTHEHAHSHQHGHAHHATHHNFRYAFWLNLVFAVVEIVGGIMTNSLAILSNALHDIGDSIALGAAWYLEHYAGHDANAKYSYGHRRFSLLSALISSVILLSGGITILIQAVPRLWQPQAVHAGGMFWLALLGIAINAFAALRLRGEHGFNAKAMMWHFVEDMLGWIAVLVVGAVMLFWTVPILDTVLTLGITVYVMRNVFINLRATVQLFLQAVPAGVDLPAIEKELCALNSVQSSHHTHIWSLDGERHVLTSHLSVRSMQADELLALKQAVQAMAQKHGFVHTTIEIECADQECSMALSSSACDSLQHNNV